MVQRFYQNPGSLTAAMRATVENLNQQLVERNLRTTGKGQYIIGRLILGVLREAQLILAQCGPTHAFHLSGRDPAYPRPTDLRARAGLQPDHASVFLPGRADRRRPAGPEQSAALCLGSHPAYGTRPIRRGPAPQTGDHYHR